LCLAVCGLHFGNLVLLIVIGFIGLGYTGMF
jgi:hypothetical protein